MLVPKMNVFELGIIAAPIAGLVAGSRAATGHGPTVVVVCSLGGLLIGAAAYFGPVFASGFIWSRVRDPETPPDRPGSIEWVAGTAVVLLAALSPLVAWVVAGYSVSRLLGFAS
jgi:Na+/proline symporter